MNNSRHIWEGWVVQDFINHLDITFKFKNFTTKKEIQDWCKSEQPYYKKRIPEVENYFINKAMLNS